MVPARHSVRTTLLPLILLLVTSLTTAWSQVFTNVTGELMMDAQGANATLLGRLFGPDPSTVLSFSSSVDEADGIFSYSSAPGSTYLGQPLSLSVSGTFDSASDLWEMSASGALGGTSLSGTGSESVTGDPLGSWLWNWGPLDAHARSTIVFTQNENGIIDGSYSSLTGGLSVSDTDVATFSAEDNQNPDGSWTWTSGSIQIGGYTFTINSEGSEISQEGNNLLGSFQTQILPVPEPSTFTLLGIGTLSLLACFRRRKAKA